MLCSILSSIYGRDTRPVQVINLIASILWCVMLGAESSTLLEVGLPLNLVANGTFVFWLSVAVIVFGLGGFLTKGRNHQVFKSFALSLGAMVQAIIANAYVTLFPPLDMQIVVSTVLSVWYLLAVFYIFMCEGTNERADTE